MDTFPSMFADKKERPSGKGRFLVGDLESVGLIRATRKASDIHILTLQDYFSGAVSYTHLTLPTICSV